MEVDGTLVTTVDRLLIVLRQLEPALSLLFTVVPGQQPKVLETHPGAAPVLCGASVVVLVTLVEEDDRVLTVVGQLDPALSLLFTAVPGQQPKVLETHAGAAPVLCSAIVLVLVTLVEENDRVLTVVGQFEPALSRLLTEVPGQQPKSPKRQGGSVLRALLNSLFCGDTQNRPLLHALHTVSDVTVPALAVH